MILFDNNLINYIQANRDKCVNPRVLVISSEFDDIPTPYIPTYFANSTSTNLYRTCLRFSFCAGIIFFSKNFISLLTNYIFTSSSTRRLSITDGGYHII